MMVKSTSKIFKEEIMECVKMDNLEVREAHDWIKANGELVWSHIFKLFKKEYSDKVVSSFDMIDFFVKYSKTI